MKGNATPGPMKALDDKSLLEGGQRWRFVPMRSRLNNTSARPSALPAIDFDANLQHIRPDDTTFSHFASSLETNAEINLTATFTDYVDKVKPLAVSLPLVFRNRKKILTLTLSTLHLSTENGAEATPAVANCLTALSKDLGPQQFHPFFPRLVSDFALVFDTSKGARNPSNTGVATTQTHSMFWDPQLSMVPLFASLAEITKNHLQYLASDPNGTLRSLLPLLSNSHYRVREMTAEASLGYLLRKTRDQAVLQRLTVGILNVFLDSPLPDASTDAAVDGLGAALFEAVRLPSGRLHSRGGEVLSYALGHLGAKLNEDRGDGELTRDIHEQMLAVVSRCFAGLSLYLKDSTDVQAVYDTLLTALEDAKVQRNERQAGNVAFLLRKSLQRGARLLAALKRPSIQIVLNALGDAIEVFIDCPRVVFEGLGALAAVVVGAADSQLQHSASRALCTAMAKVAGSARVASLTAAMAVALRLRTGHRNKGTNVLMTDVYALLCEQFAKLSDRKDESEFRSAVQNIKSKHALEAALLWVRTEAGIHTSGSCGRGFHAPTLERELCEMSIVEGLREQVEYFSAVLLSHPQGVFEKLFAAKQLSACDLALVLQAFSFQFGRRHEMLSAGLVENAKVAVGNILDSHATTLRQVDTLKTLRVFVISFPNLMRDVLSEKDAKLREYVAMFLQNLSSREHEVRMESSELLSCFTECLGQNDGPKLDGDSDNERDDDGVLQRMLAKLRHSLGGRHGNLAGFYQTLRLIMGADASLKRIENTLRLLQELGRLLRAGKDIDPTAIEASVHFSIGLLRTPLKLLWPAAAEIWLAATNLQQEVSMGVMVNQIRIVEEELLKERSEGQRNEVAEEEKEDDRDGEISDDEFETGNPVMRDNCQDTGTSTTLSADGSNPPSNSKSRKRPRAARGTFKGSVMTDNISKRQRKRDRESLVRKWTTTEWMEFCNERAEVSLDHLKQLGTKKFGKGTTSCTDNLTLVRELLGTLIKEPKHTVPYRSKIIQSYLFLDPSVFSRRAGDSIALRFANLLEKMGGLKCCENDKTLELRMRDRLLSDLTRTAGALQVAALRCLCISRCPSLKPHRDSFIRLVEEASFREELTVLTETLFPNWESGEEGVKLSSEKDLVVDVLVRICFSKMGGKRAKMESRRSAVLSFIVSKLPDEVALPRITKLVLSPVADVVDRLSLPIGTGESLIGEWKFPPLNMQLGVLSSIEAILKHCKRSLPCSSWEKIGKGSFLLLKNAKSGAAGQNIRSRTLRVIGDMCVARPEDTKVLVLPTLETVRRANFDIDGRGDAQAAPALLHFISSVFTTDLCAVQESVIDKEPWVLKWSLRLLEAEATPVQTVKLSLAIAEQLVSLLEGGSNESEFGVFQTGSEKFHFVLSLLGSSLRALLLRLVQDTTTNRIRQKAWAPAFESSLALTERLVRTEFVKADVLLDLSEGLVSFVSGTRSVSKTFSSALRTLTAVAMAVTLGGKETEVTMSNIQTIRERSLSLVPLVGERRFIQDNVAYAELCRLLGSLGLQDMRAVSSILDSMNAMESSRLDSPDLDKRVDGLNHIIKSFKSAIANLEKSPDLNAGDLFISVEDSEDNQSVECGKDGVIALVYGCVASIRFDDVAIRGTSSYALQLIAKWVAIANSPCAVSCREEVFPLLLESFVSAKVEILRREYCRSFAELVRNCAFLSSEKSSSDEQIFGLLKMLSNQGDKDSEFFENVVHMQAHRRGRALRRLEKEFFSEESGKLSDPNDSDSRAVFASRFAFPLGLQIALESGTVGEKEDNRHSRHNEAKDSAKRDVLIWAVSLVGASSKWMAWPVYRSRITGLMRRLQNSTADEQNDVLYKVVVKFAEAFPYQEGGGSAEESPRKQFLVDTLLPGMLAHVSRGGFEGELLDTNPNVSGVSNGHRGKAPPTVYRAPLAIAAGHLLKLLPESDVDVLISLLITPLANALRSRMHATRDSAKKALTFVVLTLGSRYLSYILRQVLAALRQGHRKDACVYVIHAILLGIKNLGANAASEGQPKYAIDAAADIMSSYLASELESGTAVLSNDFEDPNATSTRQKQASARAARALECYELLSEDIIFEKSARIVIQPLGALLSSSSSAKLSSRVENALQKVVVGFSRNRSMLLSDAFRLCHDLISSSSEVQKALVDEAGKASDVLTNTCRNLSMEAQSDYRLTKFGFLLLSSIINKNMEVLSGPSSASRQLQSMLEPFLPLTAQILGTKHDTLKLTTFKCAQKLLRLPLSNKGAVGEKMSETIIDVLSQNGGVLTHTDDLFNTCLRAAAVLLHEVGEQRFKNVPQERVETLISVACNCIESGGVEARTAAMALLRATVTSGIAIPAVYDAMEKVNKLAIRAQSSTLRAACTSLSIAFMISFPMGSKRVRQQLEFFVRNLNYRLPNGRLAALEAVKAIILKFPAEVLENECDYLFVALAASAARDVDTECRSSAIQRLQQLFERIPVGRKTVDMLRMASVFLGAESSMGAIDEDIKVIACKDTDVALSGAFAMSAACKSGRLTLAQLGMVTRVLLAALQNQPEDAMWEITYGLLQGIEHALEAQGDVSTNERLELQGYLASFWKLMPQLLVHKHQWVRLSSARLLGKHLSASGGREARRDGVGKSQFSALWCGGDLVRSLLRSCCLQLEANHLSQDLGQQCLKNLLCIGHVIFRNPEIGNIPLEDKTTAEDQNEESANYGTNRGVKWLVARMSGIGSRIAEKPHEMLRRGCALRFLLVSTKWWGSEFVGSNAEAYVAPVVRILEAPSTPSDKGVVPGQSLDADGLRELATLLQDALVETLGATVYYDVYQGLRNKREDLKNARKRQAAFELAINPEMAAKKRRKRAENKKNKRNKKRGRTGRVEDEIDKIRQAKESLTADL